MTGPEGPPAATSPPVLVDLRPRLRAPRIRDLLMLSMGSPTPEKIDRVAREFRTLPERRLFGLAEPDGGRVLGIVGLELCGHRAATIHALGVVPEARRHGLGRRLVDEAARRLHLKSLDLETDADALPFYRALGFEVVSLGEKHPGVQRFRCTRG